jgi:glycerol-3-phosphate dehydrogenase
MYDILAGKENMESSYLMSKGKALETFPMLKSEGLVGALVYYDGGIPLKNIHSYTESMLGGKVNTTTRE